MLFYYLLTALFVVAMSATAGHMQKFVATNLNGEVKPNNGFTFTQST